MHFPPPVVVGLTLCRDYLRDQATGLAFLVRVFSGHAVESFPAVSEPFCVMALLTSSHGEYRTELVVTFFGETESYEYARLKGRVRFPDPLLLVECIHRLNQFPFHEPGVFTLLIDDEWAAQKSLRVYSRESPS